MFYSHQLLARKAPLGQIWMAATMHAKINRKKLNQLNIIKICEEILNPSVPMALRLSGILMGGVVIVYERKVKLLYEDVNRLLVEINEAWKVKAVPDPTVLPKGKTHARPDVVTLPEIEGSDIGNIEQSLQLSNANANFGFERSAYIAMRLDSVHEDYINGNEKEDDASTHYHQADPANITLVERFTYQHDTNTYNRFERFDIEGDDETQVNFTSGGSVQVPVTLRPSPVSREEPLQDLPTDDFVPFQYPDHHVNEHLPTDDFVPNMRPEHRVDQQQEESTQMQGPPRKRARKPAAFCMDYEQTIISGHVYQSWLQSASDLVSRHGRKRKRTNILSIMKIGDLMEVPPVALIYGLVDRATREIHYPAPILKLWMKVNHPIQNIMGKISSPQSPQPEPVPEREPPSLSPSDRVNYQEPVHYPVADFHSGASSHSIEKLRKNPDNRDIPVHILMEELRTNLMGARGRLSHSNPMITPDNQGNVFRSAPSSVSDHAFPSHSTDVDSVRSNKRRLTTSARHSGSSLQPVAEDNIFEQYEPNFELSKLSENGQTHDHERLLETGPTQTQHPFTDPTLDKITDTIRTHLKTHFETPGAPQTESLNNLSSGMNRKRAAQLFYQTCVLASRDFLKVEQRAPYGDILISVGAKM